MAQVRGVEELVRKLMRLKKTDVKKAVRKGSRAGCKLLLPIAKANAPYRTGALRKEVKVRAIRRSRRWTGTQVTTKVEGGPTYYGGFVEYGTKKMAARHFIRNAFDQAKAGAEGAFVRGIAQGIEESVSKR